MSSDEKILENLDGAQNLSGTMVIDERSYQITSMSVVKSSIPVRKPTTRGGVYFTDTTAYKIKAITPDLSVASEIPMLMLGPNTDFKPVRVMTEITIDGKKLQAVLTTHLTNAVNTQEKIELNLIVDRADLK